MMLLPRRVVLALEAMVDIAIHARPIPVRAEAIAKRQGMARRALEQILQQLVRGGVLKGVRGPRGGYCLARERRRITVGEVVRVMSEGDDDTKTGSGSPLDTHVMRPLCRQWEEAFMQSLDAVTIDDLCRRAEKHDIVTVTDADTDFTI